MAFHSLSYLLFLPVVFLAYNYLPSSCRLAFLLAASGFFYLSLGFPYLLGVLALVTLVTYGAGIAVAQAGTLMGKRLFFWSGVVCNILVLVWMKYVPFIAENLSHFSWFNGAPVRLLASIGVSYFVFQAIAYLANILLGVDEPECDLGYFALYMAFFPKLLQGPIERPGDLLPQLKQKYRFDYQNVRSGLTLFAWGLMKKVIVADRLGPYVDQVYGNVTAYSGISLIVATYLYAIQIYCDFSGYTDMALGAARLFNINLTPNFNYPYLATSIADFWRRWHISLSRWIMDYIFKPLHASWRYGRNYGTAGALMAAFLVSGFWHGAAWTYIAWGALHGIYLSASIFYKPVQKRIYARSGMAGTKVLKCWQIFITFQMICFSWIFFRAASMSDALYVVQNLFRNLPDHLRLITGKEGFKELVCMGQGTHDLLVALLAMTILITFAKVGERTPLAQRSTPVRWLAYYATVIAIIFYGSFDNTAQFIYFQF